MSDPRTERLWEVLLTGATRDAETATELLRVMCTTAQDMWESMFAIAFMVADAAERNQPGRTGPLVAEVEVIPGASADPLDVDAVQQAAAFIAAVGNGDHDGALLVFAQGGDTEETAARFVANVVGIGCAFVRGLIDEEHARG